MRPPRTTSGRVAGGECDIPRALDVDAPPPADARNMRPTCRKRLAAPTPPPQRPPIVLSDPDRLENARHLITALAHWSGPRAAILHLSLVQRRASPHAAGIRSSAFLKPTSLSAPPVPPADNT